MDQSGIGRSFYEELVARYADDVYRYAYRLAGSVETAEDLSQETYVEAWRSIGSLRDPEKGRAWLCGILRHRYARWVRTAQRTPKLEISLEQLGDQVSVPDPEALEVLSRRELLQTALNNLEDRYKEPFLMVFLEGVTCREAAEHLKLPLGTVLSRIHRARQYMRASLQVLDPDR